MVNGHHLAPGIRTSRQASRVRRRRNAVESSRRIAAAMTESKKTLESEGTTARPKEKPYVPIENRPLLGVDEVEALTGVPAKIIRANVRNGLLKACLAGSTTMRIRRRDLDEWLDMLPAWRA